MTTQVLLTSLSAAGAAFITFTLLSTLLTGYLAARGGEQASNWRDTAEVTAWATGLGAVATLALSLMSGTLWTFLTAAGLLCALVGDRLLTRFSTGNRNADRGTV
jgi:uncharacterized membrane protein